MEFSPPLVAIVLTLQFQKVPHFECFLFLVKFFLPSGIQAVKIPSRDFQFSNLLQKSKVTVGVLAIQGSVAEHAMHLRKCGALVVPVRTASDLAQVGGLVLPGGESTAIGRIWQRSGLDRAIAQRVARGMPAWGTCAGAILLSRVGSEFSLKVLDVKIARNAFGSQAFSFEEKIPIPALQIENFPATFIRAPRILQVGPNVKVLARLGGAGCSKANGEPVFVREGNALATTFHPELVKSLAVHKFFVRMCADFSPAKQ